MHVHVIQIDFGLSVRIGLERIGIRHPLAKYDKEKGRNIEQQAAVNRSIVLVVLGSQICHRKPKEPVQSATLDS